MIHSKGLETGLRDKLNSELIVRKLYLCYPTYAFIGEDINYDIQFEIFNSISEFFDIPITSIKVAGSGQTGYSYHKKKEFEVGKSDLDIAIIDLSLYNKYIEICYNNTNGLRDYTKFRDQDTFKQYCKNLARGLFRPDLMPRCKEKSEWFEYFGKLSEKYFKEFKNINAGIYASQKFFEHKQAESIDKYLDGGKL